MTENSRRCFLPVILLISLLLALFPLAGIVWFVVTGTLTSVDGLFGCLILLSLSAIFLLDVFWQMRDRGWLHAGNKNKESSKAAGSEEG
jgi:hypothetical protein